MITKARNFSVTITMIIFCLPLILMAQNIAGTWKLDVVSNAGGGEPTFSFVQEGEKLTGTYMGMFGETNLEGNVKGDQIEFSFMAQGLKITYKGKVDTNTMSGDCDFGGMAVGTFKGSKTALDVSGNWSLEVKLDAGSGTPNFSFEQNGEKLTGLYKGSLGEASIEGTLTGIEIEFSFEVQGSKIHYKGKVETDGMSGSCDYGGFASGTFQGKKIQ
jgi:hypothetical protein